MPSRVFSTSTADGLVTYENHWLLSLTFEKEWLSDAGCISYMDLSTMSFPLHWGRKGGPRGSKVDNTPPWSGAQPVRDSRILRSMCLRLSFTTDGISNSQPDKLDSGWNRTVCTQGYIYSKVQLGLMHQYLKNTQGNKHWSTTSQLAFRMNQDK